MRLTNLFSRIQNWLSRLFTPFRPPARDAITEPAKPVSLLADLLNQYASASLYGDETARKAVIRTLVRLSPITTPALVAHLHDPNPCIRAGVIAALLAAKRAEFSQYLAVALQEADETVYQEVIEALHEVHIPTENLLLLLEAPQPRIRAGALALMGVAGTQSEARTITRMALHEADDEVRAAAMLALAKIRHPQAVESLNMALYSENSLTSRRAGEALLRIGTPEAKQAVRHWRERRFASSEDFLSRRTMTEELIRDRQRSEKKHFESR